MWPVYRVQGFPGDCARYLHDARWVEDGSINITQAASTSITYVTGTDSIKDVSD